MRKNFRKNRQEIGKFKERIKTSVLDQLNLMPIRHTNGDTLVKYWMQLILKEQSKEHCSQREYETEYETENSLAY